MYTMNKKLDHVRGVELRELLQTRCRIQRLASMYKQDHLWSGGGAN